MTVETLLDPRTYYERVLELLEKHHAMYRKSIPLIASENVVSPAVREALASDFGHRYAEGWPGERLYAGCKYIDEVELMAIELGRLFLKQSLLTLDRFPGLSQTS
jgi:glycine hydroxymethyltransferase